MESLKYPHSDSWGYYCPSLGFLQSMNWIVLGLYIFRVEEEYWWSVFFDRFLFGVIETGKQVVKVNAVREN